MEGVTTIRTTQNHHPLPVLDTLIMEAVTATMEGGGVVDMEADLVVALDFGKRDNAGIKATKNIFSILFWRTKTPGLRVGKLEKNKELYASYVGVQNCQNN